MVIPHAIQFNGDATLTSHLLCRKLVDANSRNTAIAVLLAACSSFFFGLEVLLIVLFRVIYAKRHSRADQSTYKKTSAGRKELLEQHVKQASSM